MTNDLKRYIEDITGDGELGDQLALLEALKPWRERVQRKMDEGMSRQDASAAVPDMGLLFKLFQCHVLQVALICQKIHRRYQPDALELEDLLQESFLLWRAVVASFDDTRGTFGQFVGKRMFSDLRDYVLGSAGGGGHVERISERIEPVHENMADPECDMQEELASLAELLDPELMRKLMAA